MRLPEDVQNDIANSVLCWLATADASGFPSVSPKEVWAPFGEEAVVIADIASANSVRNLRSNPRVCVSFIDIFRQKGFKLYGVAQVLTSSDRSFSLTD